MRIVCQKCSAAYAIDDKLVTPKGVRAQCPRCRHLQLVKHEGGEVPPLELAEPPSPMRGFPPAPPPLKGPPPANPFLFDMGGTPQPQPPPPAQPPRVSAPPAIAPIRAAPPPPSIPPAARMQPPPPPPPPGPAPFAFDFSAPPPSLSAPQQGFGPPPPPNTEQPSPFDFAAPPADPFAFDLPGPLTEPAAAPATIPVPADTGRMFDLVGASSGQSSPSGVGLGLAEVRCKSCNTVLTDPFDQALGTCDECRSKLQETSGDYGAEPSSRIEHIDTSMLAPVRSAPVGQTFVPVTTSSLKEAKVETAFLRSATREGAGFEGGNRKRTIGIAAGVLAAVALVAVVVVKKPWERRRPPPVIMKAAPNTKPVDVVVQAWRMKYPELDGASADSAKRFITAGEEGLAKDSHQGYLDAEEAFQKALVIDRTNERAIEGWVFALAFGRGNQIDDQTANGAESMLAAAEQKTGDPRLYIAHAHLSIARNGNANDIQVLADRGKSSQSNADKALAKLAVGQSMLAKNQAMASAALAEALELDPKLKRGYFFQARLAESTGKYRDAAVNLEKRLELDPDQWEAAESLARISVDVGELPKARKVLEAAVKVAPRNAKARIGLATLQYQHLGEVAQAIELLSATVADKELAASEAADAYMHLAAAARVAGDIAKSVEASEKALELSPASVPAKLQHFLAMLEKNVTSQARIDLDSLKGQLGDAQLDNVLEGRLLVAQNRFDEAAAILGKVHEADPRRADALLLAGAAAARAKQDGKAWGFCLNRGSKLDPLSYPLPSMTQLFVRPADILKPAIGAYASLNPSGGEDPNPELCEGLVAWFSEDLVSADKRFAKVAAIDQKNADSYAYRTLIALRKKDVGSALRLGGKAVDAARTNGLAHYSLAAALMAANKPDAAKPEATNANNFAAWLLAPRVLMADGEARLKNPDEARRLATGVLLADAYYRDAKRVLYKHSL